MTELEQGYLTPLRVENVDSKNWKFLEEFAWRGSQNDVFIINPGERTDFASVPWWTQSILPRTGAWTKAAALHDKMCNLQNQRRRLLKERKHLLSQGVSEFLIPEPEPLVFSSIDTDAIFRKNARMEGTDRIRAELLWFGVRCGALANPARCQRWWRTFPRWFADLITIVAVLHVLVYLMLWVAHLGLGIQH